MDYADIVLMEESKEKAVSSNGPESSTEIVFEWVDGEGGQGEGSDNGAGVGCCNVDDIMVEVLGSHVYVDGICTTDGGAVPGSNSIDEPVCLRDSNGEGCHLEDNFRRLYGEGQDVVLDSGHNASELKSIQEEAVREAEFRNEGHGPLIEGFSASNAVNGEKQGSEEGNFSPGNDTDHADLGRGEKMEVEKQVNDGQKVNVNGDQEVQINGGSVMAEILGEGDENICVVQSFVANAGEVGMNNNNDSSLNGDHAMPIEEDQKQVSFDGNAINPYSDGLDMGSKETVIGTQHYDLHSGKQMEDEEQKLDPEQPSNAEEDTIRQAASTPGRQVKVHQPKYQLPPEDHEFFVSDLVWGKVRSHPWWPGQIFYPSDPSEKAIEHQKDNFLIAYFGDQTFAWNETSLLKPFRTHFSLAVNHPSSEAFRNAVDCALEEVSRRVQMGLTCSCSPKDRYDKIRFQVVENTGIRQGSSIKDGTDRCSTALSFKPDKLLEYMKALALCPSAGGDRLELMITKAQLSSFYCLRGCHPLPEYQSGRGLIQNDANNSAFEESRHVDDLIEHALPMKLDDEPISSHRENVEPHRGSHHKRKHDLKGQLYPFKRKRSLSEVMGETFDSLDTEGSDGKAESKLSSPSSSMKCKSVDSFSEEMQEGRRTFSVAKVSQSKAAFKLGHCISQVASQMTAWPSVSKETKDRLKKLNGMKGVAANCVGLPSKILKDAVTKCSSSDKEGCKRKRSSDSHVTSVQTYEFEDKSDAYWTDRIVQSESKEQLANGNVQGKYDVAVTFEKQVRRGSKYREHYCEGNHNVKAEEPSWHVNKRTPAELVLTFSELKSIPSESKLNKMFRHFGPLKESKTEVDFETSRARVVFKKCIDAEVALNSAEKFQIFGAASVYYKLNYSISESFRASLYAPTLDAETPMMTQTLGEHTPYIGSTTGNHSLFVASSLGEETSLMVSTSGDVVLPTAASFREENSYMTVMLNEETLHVVAAVGDETFPTSTTERVESASGISRNMTSKLSETNGEQTMPVDPNTVEGLMVSVTTLGEQISAGFVTPSVPTTAVDTCGNKCLTSATLAEESFPATLENETLAVAVTSGEVALTVDVASMVTTTSGTATRTLDDGTLGKTSATTVLLTVAETSSSVVTTISEAASSLMMTIDEPTSTLTTVSDMETASAEGNESASRMSR